MSLFEKINKDIVEAMKAKDEIKLRATRAIKAAFLLAGTETGNKEISDEIAMKAMQKMAKQRKDSIDIFLKENRQDLAQKEQEELSVIETYLPKALSKDELVAALRGIVQNVGAEGMKDIGKIMPVAMKELGGVTDGKSINEALKVIFSA